MGRYVPNPRFEEQIKGGLPMRNLMETASRRVEGGVRTSSPTGGTGAYRRSLGHEVVMEKGSWIGRVFTTDRFWHLIEFGSINNPVYAPLRRGLEKVLRRTKRIGKGGE